MLRRSVAGERSVRAISLHYATARYRSAAELATSGTLVLYRLINVVVTPLAGIMTALLYLKTRHAGGESLRDAERRQTSSTVAVNVTAR